MPMIKCHECGELKSDTAGKCPHCGAAHNYGGYAWLLAAVVMIAVIARCVS